MDMIKRKKDMILGHEDIEPIFSIPEFPILFGTTLQDRDMDEYATMEWGISKGSGMIQLTQLVPLEKLYSSSHNSGIGKMWTNHHSEFAEFIHEYHQGEGILEIGGGNGILNSAYTEKYGKTGWYIIEPSNVHKAEGCTAKYINAFYGRGFHAGRICFDTLVHSHLIEHQYDLNEFMELNADILDKGKRMIFSMPNMKEWVKRKYSNALNFEHTYFITEEYVDWMLLKNDFKILEKRRYCDDHSLFYAVEKENKNSSIVEKMDFDALYQENMQLFSGYIKFFQDTVTQFNDGLKQHNARVYLFGGHIFSQMLIEFGLDTSNIECILDNDSLKQGKRLYGTDLYVKSPCILKNQQNPIVILKTAAYAKEIKEDILENINAGTIFWE